MTSGSSKSIVAAASVLLTVVLLGATARVPDRGNAPVAASLAAPRAEIARIQAHIAAAESLVAAGDLSGWSPAQRLARARNLQLLRVYRERGIFPRNIDFPGHREPYFVDDRSVMCAMAFLVAASGRHDIVDRIRATRNNARIRELGDDTALVAWLDAAGLTVAEAARIQPTYGGGGGCCYIASKPTLSGSEAAVQAAGIVTSTIGIAFNVPFARTAPPRPWETTVGVLGGLLGVGVGLAAPHPDEDRAASTFRTANIAAGTISIGLGIYRMLSKSPPKPAVALNSSPAAVAGARTSRGPLLTLAPILGASSGVRFNIAF